MKLRNKKTIRKKIICTVATVMAMPMNVYASTATEDALTGLDTLVNIAGNVITAIGAFVVLWGIFEFGNAMQQHDGAQQAQAGKRIAGGLVMVAAPQLLKLFI